MKRRRKSFLLRHRFIRLYVRLEHDLGAKLQYAGAPVADRGPVLAALRSSPRRIDLVELRVVEGVATIRPEFEVSPFGHREVLVKRGCEINTARADKFVFSCIAKTEVRPLA